MTIPLLCTVRGCAQPLVRESRGLRCANDHAFDFARSGYANLLQPQDRRSPRPGDRKEAVLARRRLLESGHGDALFDALCSAAAPLPASARVLDVGCGEGSHLGRLAERLPIDGSGIDISADAVDLAARRYPGLTWVVANADRGLPYPEATFDLIASITARRNPSEFARVLRRNGRLFIAIPAADDLAELREAVQGESVERSRGEGVVAEMSDHFDVASRTAVRERRALDRDALLDLLHATYRGLRRSEQARAKSLERLDVTFAWDVLTFRPRGE